MAGKTGSLLRELKYSRTLRRTLGIYMVVTLVMFMTILGSTINQMVVHNNEQWLNEAGASIRQAQALNTSNIRSISDYMLKQLESYEVLGLLYSSDYSTYLSIRARDIYEQLSSISTIVRSIQMVNFQTGTVIDGNGRYTFANYGDQQVLELLGSLEPSLHTRVYYHPRVMNTSASRLSPVERKVVSMIYYLNKAGALVVNLDYDIYEGLILSNGSESPTDYYLINNQGLLFCATDDTQFAASMNGTDLYDQVLSQEADEGSFVLEGSGGRKTVTYLRNTILGANYVAVTEKAGLYPGSSMLWQIIGLAVLFVAASTLLSTALALLTSKPIRNLHKSVREQMADELPEEDGRMDEISYLGSVYQSIMDSNRTLTEKSKLYQHERESQMLLKLMNPDSPSLSASAATVSELETQFARPLYRVVAMMPDRRKIQMEIDAQTIRHKLAATAGEILCRLGTVRTVFPPSFQVLFLLNTDQEEQENLPDVLAQALAASQQALGGMALYMGVGESVTSLDEVSASYSGAVEAMQHAYVRQLTGVIRADQLVFPDLNTQSYAFDLDAEITKAIRHMEKKDAESAIIRFFDRISQYNHNQFLRNILHLDVAFQRLENSLQIEPPSLSSRLDTTTVMHWNAEDARQYFIRRALLDIAQLTDMKKPASAGSSELIERIDRMIEQNIFNPDFSIAQLADEFSFSVNYLRSLYKSGAGESLSARITRKRVEAACDLLDHTDESIESITMKLGFSTRNYFFTFFKKHMGMTPAQYRNR